MKAASLNLLRHPRRWSLADSVAPVSALAGLLLGLLLASAWGMWSRSQYAEWRIQRDELQARLRSQDQATARMAEGAKQVRWQQQAQLRQQDWQIRREQLLRLHDRLGQAAAEQGLRVQQWQGNEQRVQLLGRLAHAQAWPALQAQLSLAGPQAWGLQSLAAGADGSLQLALEVPWPVPAPQGQTRTQRP